MKIIGALDINDKPVEVGSIIDIHQTVNGCNLFIVISDTKVKYLHSKRDYEYDILGLFETDFEIVGNYQDILDDKIESIIK